MTVLAPSKITTMGAVNRCAPERKLYLPYSALSFSDGKIRVNHSSRNSVNVHWFVVDRNEPVLPYQTLIQRYTFLNPIVRARAEAIVDEFFREDEYHQLEEYMRLRQYDLRTTMQFSPVEGVKPDDSTYVGALRPYTKRIEPKQLAVSICRLSEEDEYCLPFTVWGAYIEQSPTSMRDRQPAS